MSVILISWNSLELTSAAINTIREHTAGVTYEIIVVDNGSIRDGGATELARRFPDIQVIANPDNRGFAAANNQGLSVARGRYLLLLNSDTLQTENAIGESVHYMDAHPNVGVLGVMHRNGDAERTYQSSVGEFPRPWLEAFQLLVVHRTATPTHYEILLEQDVPWLCGSYFFIRHECVRDVGGLDERFFVYEEDIDWCLQTHKAGWKVRYWPQVSIVHLGGAGGSLTRDKTFMMYRSHLQFIRKNHGRLTASAFYLAMSLRLGVSTLFQAVRWLIGRTTLEQVRVRCRRQLQFTLLSTSKRGV